MIDNKNPLSSPERQVAVLGPDLPRLHEITDPSELSGLVTVTTKPKLVDAGHDPRRMPEHEVVADYYDFLDKVQRTAAEDESTNAKAVLEMARRFAKDTVLLTNEARREALVGLLAPQVEELRADPSKLTCLFVPPNAARKSQGLLAREAKQLVNMYAPDITNRLQVSNKLEDPNDYQWKIKNVVLDDWVVTGNQLTNNLVRALRDVRGTPQEQQWKDSIELNLLVAREDQIQDNFSVLRDVDEEGGFRTPLAVRAYFKAPAALQHEGPMPTGTHSGVDYGFESQIDTMRRYLSAHSKPHVDLPYIAAITHDS